MQYTRFLLWLLTAGLALGLAACVNPPDYPDEPVIVYEGVNKDSIYQTRDIERQTSGTLDSIIVHFSFTDGDGNLSDPDSVDVFVTDSRFPNFQPTPFNFPLIDPEGTGNGISGDFFLTLANDAQSICCRFDNRICVGDERYPVDTFSYLIQIQDRDGNLSNTIRTEPIKILCLFP
jgi:hypothetical protein